MLTWDKFGVVALKIGIGFVILILGGNLIKWLHKIVDKVLEKANIDHGVASFITKILGIALNVVLAISVIGYLGFDTTPILTLLGTIVLAVGMSLKDNLSNFAGGLLILVLKPFVIGDYIITGSGQEGYVREIDIFYTKIMTGDNRLIAIPNGTLSNAEVTNIFHEEKRRVDILFGVAYGSEFAHVKKVLENVASCEEHVIKEEPVTVWIKDFGESAIAIEFRTWVKAADYWEARARLYEMIKLEFERENISIPFNQLEVKVLDK